MTLIIFDFELPSTFLYIVYLNRIFTLSVLPHLWIFPKSLDIIN